MIPLLRQARRLFVSFRSDTLTEPFSGQFREPQNNTFMRNPASELSGVPQMVALPILASPSGPFKPHSLHLPKAASFKSLFLKRPYTASLPFIFAQRAPDTSLRL